MYTFTKGFKPKKSPVIRTQAFFRLKCFLTGKECCWLLRRKDTGFLKSGKSVSMWSWVRQVQNLIRVNPTQDFPPIKIKSHLDRKHKTTTETFLWATDKNPPLSFRGSTTNCRDDKWPNTWELHWTYWPSNHIRGQSSGWIYKISRT